MRYYYYYSVPDNTLWLIRLCVHILHGYANISKRHFCLLVFLSLSAMLEVPNLASMLKLSCIQCAHDIICGACLNHPTTTHTHSPLTWHAMADGWRLEGVKCMICRAVNCFPSQHLFTNGFIFKWHAICITSSSPTSIIPVHFLAPKPGETMRVNQNIAK